MSYNAIIPERNIEYTDSIEYLETIYAPPDGSFKKEKLRRQIELLKEAALIYEQARIGRYSWHWS